MSLFAQKPKKKENKIQRAGNLPFDLRWKVLVDQVHVVRLELFNIRHIVALRVQVVGVELFQIPFDKPR